MRWRRWATVSLLTVTGAALTWWLAWVVLSPDRGLERTDETLYLLAAEPPSRTALWNVPWGWHTRPLFLAVGGDIARFRIVGAVLLVAAAVFAALMTTWLMVGRASPRPAVHVVLLGGAVVVAVAGALMYYADLLRTPSYNWLNLVGLLVAVGGFCGLLGARSAGWERWAWIAVVAFGLFWTLPAKPSTAPIIVAIVAPLLVATHGLRGGLGRVAAIAGAVAGFVVLAVATNFWPWNMASTVSRSANLPQLVEAQKPVPALREFVLVPVRVVEHFRLLPGSSQVLLGASVALAVLVWSGRLAVRPAAVCRWVAFGTAMWVALRTAAVPLPGVDVPLPSRRLIIAPMTTSSLAAIVAAVAVAAPSVRSGRPTRRQIAALLMLVVSPFVFGFGSSNMPYAQASMAVVFLLVAAFVIVAWRAARSSANLLAVGLVVAFSVIVGTVTLAESRGHVYRSGAIGVMSEPIEVGRRPSTVLVQPDLAEAVSTLRNQARQAGWTPGQPMLAIRYRWSAFEPYALGAGVPESLMLTLFGYPGSLEVARYNVDRLDPDQWRSAWLLVDDPATLAPDARRAIDAVITMVEERLGLRVADAYVCAVAVNGVELWRPRDTTVPPDSTPACS